MLLPLLRLLNVTIVLLMTVGAFFSLVFGTEPARRLHPLPWTILPFAVLLAGVAYAFAAARMSGRASGIVLASLVGILVTLAPRLF